MAIPFYREVAPIHRPNRFDLQGAVKHFSCKAGVDLGAGAEGCIFVVSAIEKNRSPAP